MQKLGVIGAGAWGTALAAVAARAGREVMLYARDAATATQVAATRENPRLPGLRLDAGLAITADIARAARADLILIATPAQNLRAAVTALATDETRVAASSGSAISAWADLASAT